MTRQGTLVAVVDQGSTSTKGALMTAGGECRFETTRPVARRVEGASVEHDPAELAAGLDAVLAEVLDAGEATSVGLACQRSTCLVWERESGEPLTPALSWQDRSEAARIAALSAHAADVARRSGLRLSPHYAAGKLARLLERLPRGRQRAAAGELVAGTLDAFLVRRLTGRDATEPGHAGRTLLYDLAAGRWSAELCELFGVPRAALPELRASGGDWGRCAGPGAGAAAGLPLAAVAGDQQAALLGHGGWEPGRTAAHFGTGAFVLASTGGRAIRSEVLLSAVLASTRDERRFQLEGSVNSAGSAVDWACRLTGERLDDWRHRPLDPERLPWVLPAFTGAAAPWWRPEAGGTIAGLGLEQGGAEVFGGVLAGVALRVLDCLTALADAGIETRVLRLSGRLTRLGGLVGLLADAGQVEVEVSADEETGLAGIARLAAAGATGDDAPLRAPAATAVRRSPAWPEARARRVRERWTAFVGQTLELAPRLDLDDATGEQG